MPVANVFGGSIPILEKALDLRSTRHNVLAANIANMDTPNFKAFEVLVEEALEAQTRDPDHLPLLQTDARHLPLRQDLRDKVIIQTAAAPEFSLRADGNTVDIDATMGKMAENTIKFKTAAQLIAGKFKSLKNAIQGGK